MGNDLITSASSMTREQFELFKRTILGNGFTDDEALLAGTICQRVKLDPFSRQIYFVRRKGKMIAQTGIDGYRSLAEDTEEFAGCDDYLFDEGLTVYQMIHAGRKQPVTATATVYRIVKGQRVPFSHTVVWAEYYPGDGPESFMWRKMPFNQLGKCAEACAIRKGFSQKVKDVYTKDEMQQADTAEAMIEAADSKPVKVSTPKKVETPPVETTATVVNATPPAPAPASKWPTITFKVEEVGGPRHTNGRPFWGICISKERNEWLNTSDEALYLSGKAKIGQETTAYFERQPNGVKTLKGWV